MLNPAPYVALLAFFGLCGDQLAQAMTPGDVTWQQKAADKKFGPAEVTWQKTALDKVQKTPAGSVKPAVDKTLSSDGPAVQKVGGLEKIGSRDNTIDAAEGSFLRARTDKEEAKDAPPTPVSPEAQKDGVTVCDCDCRPTAAHMPPMWHQRVFPGNTVAEMEKTCKDEVCPGYKKQCKDKLYRDKNIFDPETLDRVCASHGPPIAECRFTGDVPKSGNAPGRGGGTAALLVGGALLCLAAA